MTRSLAALFALAAALLVAAPAAAGPSVMGPGQALPPTAKPTKKTPAAKSDEKPKRPKKAKKAKKAKKVELAKGTAVGPDGKRIKKKRGVFWVTTDKPKFDPDADVTIKSSGARKYSRQGNASALVGRYKPIKKIRLSAPIPSAQGVFLEVREADIVAGVIPGKAEAHFKIASSGRVVINFPRGTAKRAELQFKCRGRFPGPMAIYHVRRSDPEASNHLMTIHQGPDLHFVVRMSEGKESLSAIELRPPSEGADDWTFRRCDIKRVN